MRPYGVAYDVLKVLMLRFLYSAVYQSGSSRRIETTLVISKRGNLMPQMDDPVMDGGTRKPTDDKEPLPFPGLEGQWPERCHQSPSSQSHQVELESVATGDRWGRC